MCSWHVPASPCWAACEARLGPLFSAAGELLAAERGLRQWGTPHWTAEMCFPAKSICILLHRWKSIALLRNTRENLLSSLWICETNPAENVCCFKKESSFNTLTVSLRIGRVVVQWNSAKSKQYAKLLEPWWDTAFFLKAFLENNTNKLQPNNCGNR